MSSPNDRRDEVKLVIPFKIVFPICIVALVIYSLIHLWQLIALIFIAILLSVTLNPFVNWMRKKRFPKWLPILIIAITILSLAVGFILILVPALFDQMAAVAKDLPKMRDEILSHLPEGGIFTGHIKKFLESHSPEKAEDFPSQLLVLIGQALGGLSGLVLIVILTIYFLIDGKATYNWVRAFFPTAQKEKLDQTSVEVSQVIFAYIAGQLITSSLVFVYVLIILKILGVPAALVLACFASLFDVLPIIGFILSVGIAVLLSLTVSIQTALIVLALYIFYNALENYFIVPKVYGNRLKLSTLTVLLSLLVAASLAGVIGAVIILPIVASYPIIEKIWLGKYVGRQAISEHQKENAT